MPPRALAVSGEKELSPKTFFKVATDISHAIECTNLGNARYFRSSRAGKFIAHWRCVRPLVSFVIPVKNDAARLRRCLTSIVRNDYPRELIELIVVDNDSTDGSARPRAEHAAPSC